MKKIVIILVFLPFCLFNFTTNSQINIVLLYNHIPCDSSIKEYIDSNFQDFDWYSNDFISKYDSTNNILSIDRKYLPGSEMYIITKSKIISDYISYLYFQMNPTNGVINLCFSLDNPHNLNDNNLCITKDDLVTAYSNSIRTLALLSDKLPNNNLSIASTICAYLIKNKNQIDNQYSGFPTSIVNVILGQNLNLSTDDLTQNILANYKFDFYSTFYSKTHIGLLIMRKIKYNSYILNPSAILINNNIVRIDFSEYNTCILLDSAIYISITLYYPNTGFCKKVLYSVSQNNLSLVCEDNAKSN